MRTILSFCFQEKKERKNHVDQANGCIGLSLVDVIVFGS